MKIKKFKLVVILTFAILFLGLGGIFISDAQEDGPIWQMMGHDRKNTGRSTQDTSHVDGTIEWVFDVGDNVYPPTIGTDGTVYLPTRDTVGFRAISPDGTEKWSFKYDSASMSVTSKYSAVTEDTVYLMTIGGLLYALDKEDGSQIWGLELENRKTELHSSIVIADDGTIYISSFDEDAVSTDDGFKRVLIGNTLQAINPDGTEKWSFDIEKEKGKVTRPAIGDDGTIYVTSLISEGGTKGKSTLWAVSPEGEVEWTYDGSGALGKSQHTSVADDGTIYVLDSGGGLHAVNSDGTEKWIYYATQSDVRPDSVAIGGDGTIYFTLKGFLHAVSSDGVEKWIYETEEKVTNGVAVGADGVIYFTTEVRYGDEYIKLYAANPDGTKRFSVLVDDERPGTSPVIGLNGVIYVGSSDTGLGGRLTAIGGEGDFDATAKEEAAKESFREDEGGLLWVWIGLVMAILIGGGLYFIKSGKQKKESL